MRILHVLAGDDFTEGMAYQDNQLAFFNLKDGNDVLIISSCRTWKDSKTVYIEPCDKVMDNGVRLIRLPYRRVINDYITKKLRILDGLYDQVACFKPDVIRALNPHNFSLPILAKYKKDHPNVRLYIDSHQEYFNAAIGFVSYWIFHKILIRGMLKRSYPYIDKMFHGGDGVSIFLKEMYNVPEDKLEFYPIGGIIPDENEYIAIRRKVRSELNLKDDDILLVHSGKMVKEKKTVELLEALKVISESNLKLVIVGSFPDDTKEQIQNMIASDNRVNYVGWKSGDELREYLIAGDIYVQPGTASVTAWHALCSRCAVIVSPEILSHRHFMPDSGWYAATAKEITDALAAVVENPEIVERKKEAAFSVALGKYDYRKLAARLYR